MKKFEDFEGFIRDTNFSPSQETLPAELLLAEEADISIYYAPFDYVNENAKLVICGITPGRQQANLALAEAQHQLRNGASTQEAKLAAKETASFGGPMRSNLIRMLDFIGLPSKIGVARAEEFFGSAADIVHYTSALRYPVFKSGKNYSGTPSMVRKRLLRSQLESYLAEEVAVLDQAVFVPLGPKVEEALQFLAARGILDESRVLNGMPHPSGANAERIAFFLGQKAEADLSMKTNPVTISANRELLLGKVACM
ncbi:MAG: hypothetical protein P8R04_01795 [Gammaproteobacteria bacterium]|nr:hypothetical protein [Gammaproteobacteria bacterium]